MVLEIVDAYSSIVNCPDAYLRTAYCKIDWIGGL